MEYISYTCVYDALEGNELTSCRAESIEKVTVTPSAKFRHVTRGYSGYRASLGVAQRQQLLLLRIMRRHATRLLVPMAS